MTLYEQRLRIRLKLISHVYKTIADTYISTRQAVRMRVQRSDFKDGELDMVMVMVMVGGIMMVILKR